MILRVVGVTVKSGVFENTQYNNLMFHCMKESENGVGYDCEIVKVKYSNCNDALKFVNGDLGSFIDRDIRANYNSNGKCLSIDIIEDLLSIKDDKRNPKATDGG